MKRNKLVRELQELQKYFDVLHGDLESGKIIVEAPEDWNSTSDFTENEKNRVFSIVCGLDDLINFVENGVVF